MESSKFLVQSPCPISPFQRLLNGASGNFVHEKLLHIIACNRLSHNGLKTVYAVTTSSPPDSQLA